LLPLCSPARRSGLTDHRSADRHGHAPALLSGAEIWLDGQQITLVTGSDREAWRACIAERKTLDAQLEQRLTKPNPRPHIPPIMPSRLPAAPAFWTWPSLALCLAVVLVQSLLIWNPGYYSHDELQWAAAALDRPWHELPWMGLLDWHTFQYRPLTFSLWMALSRWWFVHPYALHAAVVVLGVGNAGLLYGWLRRIGISADRARIVGLLWLLNPYAVATHAWVGALADGLWVGFGLIGIVYVQGLANAAASSQAGRWQAAGVGFATTLLALLCKEAALVLPAAYWISWIGLGRRRPTLAAALASSIAITLYLSLRLPALLDGAATTSAYAIGTSHLWQHWAEYLIFPALLARLHPGALLLDDFTLRHGLAIALPVALSAMLLRQRWQLGALWLLAPLAALVPVLPLPSSFSHYAYAASVAAALVLGLAVTGLGKAGKIVLLLWLLLVSLHGGQIAHKMQTQGQIQARLLADIDALRRRQPEQKLRIAATSPAQQELLRRSTFHIPSYRGSVWGDWVQAVATGSADANQLMQPDGHLRALSRPTTDRR